MPKKILPKLIYQSYNLLNGCQLDHYYQMARKVNLYHTPFDQLQVGAYLQKWGYHPVLEKNPLMDKETVRRNAMQVDSAKVESWAYTGGSYGEPLKVPYSRKRALIRTATFKFFNELGGYSLGDPFVLIRAKKRSPLLKFIRNEEIFIPDDISESNIAQFLKSLKSRHTRVLLGYPSVMYELALHLMKNPEEKNGLKIQSLISVSEPLEQFKRQIIKEELGCSFIDRYSNEEVGLIAQQLKFGGEYYVNKFGVLVEVIHPITLQPVKEGELGKVVVTDLFNDLVPIIRYDTGDLAVAKQYKNGQLFSIAEIEGRVTEQITATNGRPVSPLILGPYIYKPLSDVGQICQYQFAQIAKTSYQLRLKINKQALTDDFLSNMKQNLEHVLGTDAMVEIVFVADIKPQPSGKRPVFKNEIKKQA